MRVTFDGGRLNERGVAVAVYDYAHHARRLLGVEPIVLHDASGPVEADQVARPKFEGNIVLRGVQRDRREREFVDFTRLDHSSAGLGGGDRHQTGARGEIEDAPPGDKLTMVENVARQPLTAGPGKGPEGRR